MITNTAFSHFFSLPLDPFQLQCVAKIYDIYEKDVTKYIEEFYPQILANSDNGGVHFSFISDRDAAGKRLFLFDSFCLILKTLSGVVGCNEIT
jgi:hypothetical protein